MAENNTASEIAPTPEIVVVGSDGAVILTMAQVMVGADLMVRVDMLDATLRMGPRAALRVAEALRRHAIPLLACAGSTPSAAKH